MIEISHQQAQRMVRAGMDHGKKSSGSRLTQEQWASLQVHLETCEQCRNYAKQIQSTERDLSRALQGRLGPINGPQPGTFRSVMDRRLAVKAVRERLLRAFVWIAALIALAVILLMRPIFFSSEPVPIPTLTRTSLPTVPTIVTPRGSFRGVLVFESRHEGNSEIYVLNAGPLETDLTNLTRSSAQDTHPVWSPDGEWIAFLSDRDGQNEVYAISVAGSRLTRLTADPNLDWIGPLSWSPDGRWIAARAARRDQDGERYVYLVSLDGGNTPRSVAYSRGAPVAPSFSPVSNYLAFQASSPAGLIYDYSLSTGWYSAFNSYETNNDLVHSTGWYDWTPGGSNLIYIAEGPYRSGESPLPSQNVMSRVNISPGMSESSTSPEISSSPWQIAVDQGLGIFRAVTVAPGGMTAIYSQDADVDGCWTLFLQQVYLPLEVPVMVEGMCLEGGLSRSSWQPVSRTGVPLWLVVLARRPGEISPGYFALRFDQDLIIQGSSTIALPIESVTAVGLTFPENPIDWPGNPLPRPAGRRLNINPIAAAGDKLASESRMPGSGIVEHIVISRTSTAGSSLSEIRLDGGKPNFVHLVDESFSPSCPVISPDGSRIAFRFHPSGISGEGHVAVIASTGGQVLKLTGPGSATDAMPEETTSSYGCPVWSPDGRLLAAEYRAGNWTYLAIISADGSSGASFLRVEPQSVLPVWLRNGEENGLLLLAYPEVLGQPARIVSIDLNTKENQEALFFKMRASVQVVAMLPEIDAVSAFTASPDGQQIALIGVTYQFGQSDTLRSANLIFFTPEGMKQLPLEAYNRELAGERSLAWLDGGRIGFFQPVPLNGHIKAYIKLFDTQVYELETVASFNDLVTDIAWAGDGGWVIIASESGLWAQDVKAGLNSEASPVRLLKDWVAEADVR